MIPLDRVESGPTSWRKRANLRSALASPWAAGAGECALLAGQAEGLIEQDFIGARNSRQTRRKTRRLLA